MTMTRHTVKLGVLVVVALASIGCGAAEADPSTEAQAVDTSPLVARPASADFGAVALGSTATRSVTLLNSGRAPVDVTSVTWASAFPPDPCRAVVIQPCILPGESTTLQVTCSPTSAAAFGGRVAIRYHSGSDDHVLSVSVSGEGVAGR